MAGAAGSAAKSTGLSRRACGSVRRLRMAHLYPARLTWQRDKNYPGDAQPQLHEGIDGQAGVVSDHSIDPDDAAVTAGDLAGGAQDHPGSAGRFASDCRAGDASSAQCLTRRLAG